MQFRLQHSVGELHLFSVDDGLQVTHLFGYGERSQSPLQQSPSTEQPERPVLMHAL